MGLPVRLATGFITECMKKARHCVQMIELECKRLDVGGGKARNVGSNI